MKYYWAKKSKMDILSLMKLKQTRKPADIFNILPLDIKRLIVEKLNFKYLMLYSERYSIPIDDYSIKLFIEKYSYDNLKKLNKVD